MSGEHDFVVSFWVSYTKQNMFFVSVVPFVLHHLMLRGFSVSLQGRMSCGRTVPCGYDTCCRGSGSQLHGVLLSFVEGLKRSSLFWLFLVVSCFLCGGFFVVVFNNYLVVLHCFVFLFCVKRACWSNLKRFCRCK